MGIFLFLPNTLFLFLSPECCSIMLIQCVDHMLSVLGHLFLMCLPRLGRDPTVSLQWVAVTQKDFPEFSHYSPNIQVGVAFPPDEGSSGFRGEFYQFSFPPSDSVPHSKIQCKNMANN